MELISFHSAPCCHFVNIRWKLVGKSLSSQKPKLPAATKGRITCSKMDANLKELKFFDRHPFGRSSFSGQESFRSLDSFEGSQAFDLLVLSKCSDNYVVGSDEDARHVPKMGESAAKVIIPSLPTNINGDSTSPVHSCHWEWKPKFTVYYERSGSANVHSPPVLFLPGFGVGSFHYEKQLRDLGCDFRVWALDFLGQGMSLPLEDPTCQLKEGIGSDEKDLAWGFGNETEPWANELVYSTDLWRDQVSSFIQEVIGEPVYIVGNSLGGFVALYFAACNPHLVKGVALLNATPFWGFLPNPTRSPRLAKLFPWAGTFPLPANVKKLTEIFWQKISDPQSIAEVLKQVYADHSTDVDKVFSRILETTQHPAAAASLASILFAPQGQLSLREALSCCQVNNVPICLMYGKEDPWVRPIWGFQVKQQLPDAPYYQISPAGHCPHDEVPEVVNYLLRGWIRNIESEGMVALHLLDEPQSMEYGTIKDLEFVREGTRKSVKVQFFGTGFSLWNQICSYLKSLLVI